MAEVDGKRGIRDVQHLRSVLLNSPEFKKEGRAEEENPSEKSHGIVIFQHLPKCAGTAVHNALITAMGPKATLCPERHNGLWNYKLRELLTYDLFSGHFDRGSIDSLPARDKRLFTILRDPTARLLSLYAYLRSLKPEAAKQQRRNMRLAELARDLSPMAFFGNEAIRANPSIDNAMVRALAFSLPARSWEAHSPMIVERSRSGPSPTEGLELAINHLENMTAFGLVEEMDVSVAYIFTKLGLPVPPHLDAANVTKSLHETTQSFDPALVPRKTKALKALLADLVREDQKLYDHARQVLVKRGVMR